VSSVDHLPTWLLSRANARAQALLVAAFAEFGLRPVHYRTLAALAEHGGLSQAGLAGHLLLDRKDVAVSLDLLGDRRLVLRAPDPADGRRNVVLLTGEGRRLLPRLERALAAVQREVVGPLTDEEAGVLVGLLAKLGAPGVVPAAGLKASPAAGV
jgi:DNA-binding MarR family transcriptional regulator